MPRRGVPVHRGIRPPARLPSACCPEVPLTRSIRLLVPCSALWSALGCLGTPAPDAPTEVPAPPPDAVAKPDIDTSLPDVVLITLDTTRADHVGAYGYFRDTTPVFDALAAKSLLFERLVVPMATTLPTHTSLLTGTWPTEHGVLANVVHGGKAFVPSKGLTPLPVWLASLGYDTAAFVSAAPLDHTSGIATGFDVFDDPKRVERKGDRTADAALAWLAERTDRPIFLWVHFYDPHNPFNPPEELARTFETESQDQVATWIETRRIDATAKRPTGQTVRAEQAHNLYDAEIRFMDQQLGRVLDGLAARGRFDDATLLVIAGDHGEGLNQHGEPGHGLVWDEQLHAPLLMRAPGITPGRRDTLLSAGDVLPTALSLVDLPGKQAFLEQASGRNVLDPAFAARPVLSQTSQRQLEFGLPMTYALTGPTWKCRWAEGEDPVLWDLSADPFELSPVDDAERRDACVAELKAVLAAQQARAAALGSGGTTEVSEDRRKELEALGYLSDDGDE